MIDTRSSVQSAGIMRQLWPDRVMQNGTSLKHALRHSLILQYTCKSARGVQRG